MDCENSFLSCDKQGCSDNLDILLDLSDADAVDNWIHQQNLIAYVSFRALGVL